MLLLLALGELVARDVEFLLEDGHHLLHILEAHRVALALPRRRGCRAAVRPLGGCGLSPGAEEAEEGVELGQGQGLGLGLLLRVALLVPVLLVDARQGVLRVVGRHGRVQQVAAVVVGLVLAPAAAEGVQRLQRLLSVREERAGATGMGGRLGRAPGAAEERLLEVLEAVDLLALLADQLDHLGQHRLAAPAAPAARVSTRVGRLGWGRDRRWGRWAGGAGGLAEEIVREIAHRETAVLGEGLVGQDGRLLEVDGQLAEAAGHLAHRIAAELASLDGGEGGGVALHDEVRPLRLRGRRGGQCRLAVLVALRRQQARGISAPGLIAAGGLHGQRWRGPHRFGADRAENRPGRHLADGRGSAVGRAGGGRRLALATAGLGVGLGLDGGQGVIGVLGERGGGAGLAVVSLKSIFPVAQLSLRLLRDLLHQPPPLLLPLLLLLAVAQLVHGHRPLLAVVVLVRVGLVLAQVLAGAGLAEFEVRRVVRVVRLQLHRLQVPPLGGRKDHGLGAATTASSAAAVGVGAIGRAAGRGDHRGLLSGLLLLSLELGEVDGGALGQLGADRAVVVALVRVAGRGRGGGDCFLAGGRLALRAGPRPLLQALLALGRRRAQRHDGRAVGGLGLLGLGLGGRGDVRGYGQSLGRGAAARNGLVSPLDRHRGREELALPLPLPLPGLSLGDLGGAGVGQGHGGLVDDLAQGRVALLGLVLRVESLEVAHGALHQRAVHLQRTARRPALCPARQQWPGSLL